MDPETGDRSPESIVSHWAKYKLAARSALPDTDEQDVASSVLTIFGVLKAVAPQFGYSLVYKA